MKKYTLTLLAGLTLGAALVWYAFPRVQVRTEVQETVRKDIRTVVRVVERPDGSKETVTETVDRSKESSRATHEQRAASQWLGSVGVQTKFDREEPQYTATISRRILGPTFLGLSANTEGYIGLVLTLEY